MSPYFGTLIQESLENKDVLGKVRIVSTKVEEVTNEHKTPWIKQWTLHKIEIPEEKVIEVVNEISQSFDSKHENAWYADFRNDTHHYVVFPHKVFFLDKTHAEQYVEAEKYAISIGIPGHQIGFSRHRIK